MITTTDINKAKNIVFDIEFGEFPGQKIVCSYALLAKTKYFGFNTHKSHPAGFYIARNGFHHSCHHAEVSSIMSVPRQSRHKIKLFVFRFQKNGKLTMAKPCNKCKKYLTNEGIHLRNIWFSNWFGEWERFE